MFELARCFICTYCQGVYDLRLLAMNGAAVMLVMSVNTCGRKTKQSQYTDVTLLYCDSSQRSRDCTPPACNSHTVCLSIRQPSALH